MVRFVFEKRNIYSMSLTSWVTTAVVSRFAQRNLYYLKLGLIQNVLAIKGFQKKTVPLIVQLLVKIDLIALT